MVILMGAGALRMLFRPRLGVSLDLCYLSFGSLLVGFYGFCEKFGFFMLGFGVGVARLITKRLVLYISCCLFGVACWVLV